MSPTAPSHAAFPRAPLIAVGAVLAAIVVSIGAARLAGVGVAREPDAPSIAVREFRFEDRTDGSILVTDAASGRTVENVAPGTNGFLRGTMRGLARERKRNGLGPQVPFRLVGHADGRLTLEDPATGRRVDLESFGPTNAAVFAHIMSNALALR